MHGLIVGDRDKMSKKLFTEYRGGRKGLRCIAVIFISKYGIAVFRVQAVCGKFKFYAAVVGEKIVVSRGSASFS